MIPLDAYKFKYDSGSDGVFRIVDSLLHLINLGYYVESAMEPEARRNRVEKSCFMFAKEERYPQWFSVLIFAFIHNL